ncbi:MAG: hypothetical protein GX455_16140 [Phycisphaerae bacterium]|nr:hypothetical protein [Phycisphaerae bacterium]
MNKNPDIGVAVRRGIITSFIAWCILATLVTVIVPDYQPLPEGTISEPPDPAVKYRDFLGIATIPLSMFLGLLEGVRYWIDDRKKEKNKPMADLYSSNEVER